ncbi:MAG: pantoate kinase [Nitrososphaerales archaeon]
MSVAGAFSPGHITGFVEFPNLPDNPVLKGSRGAGFCISKGVKTTVYAERNKKNDFLIVMNGKYADNAEVSSYVVDEYLKLVKQPFSIRVEHDLEIPIGYGLGSSGAAALSLSLALNKALVTNLRDIEAAQIAHKADFVCRCGLGTVLAEFHGGFEMRLNAGAPGVGILEKILLDDNHKVVMFCIAPISTKEFLRNKMQLINGFGGKMLNKLKKTKSVNDFMEMSLQFAKSIDFVSEKCQCIIDAMRGKGYKCSMAMFGETVFSIVKNDDIKDVQGIFREYDGKLLVCDIDYQGARIIPC